MKNLPQILHPQRWSITAQISTALVVAAILPIGIITSYNFRDNVENTKKTEYRNLSLLAKGLANRLDQLIIDNYRVVQQLSEDSEVVEFLLATPEQQKSLRPKINQMLENFRLSSPDFEIVYLLNKNGQIVAIPPTKDNLNPHKINYKNRRYFQEAMAGKSYVSSVLVGLTSGESGIFFSTPIRRIETIQEGDSGAKVKELKQRLQKKGFPIKLVNEMFDPNTTAVVKEFQKVQNLAITGKVDAHTWKALMGTENNSEVLGVAVLKMKAKTVWDMVNGLKVGQEGFGFVVDNEGIVIAHPKQYFLYKSIAPLSPETLKRVAVDRRSTTEQLKQNLGMDQLARIIKKTKTSGQVRFFHPMEKRYKILSFTPMKHQPWIVVVSEPESQLLENFRHLAIKNGIAVIVVVSAVVLVALLLAKSIVKPISALTKTAKELEQGNYNLEQLNQVAKTDDDISNLVRVFVNMAEEIQAREQKLKQQLVELKIEIDHAKKERQVAEITETDYFQELQKKAKEMRRRNSKSQE